MAQLTGPLTPYGYVQGSLTLAFTAISLIIGGSMIYKYFRYKDKQLLYVGISWILSITPWWPDAISFVMILIGGGDTSYALTDVYYFFIANALIAPMFYTWINTFSKLVLKEKPKTRKYFVIFWVIYAIIFEVLILSMYFINYQVIGTRISAFYVDWNIVVMIYLMSASFLFTITGLIFSAETLKSRVPTIRLRGKFLMIAFITFTIGTVFEVLLIVPEISEISLVFARVFGIIASIAFYIGFVLPKFIKNLFVKE